MIRTILWIITALFLIAFTVYQSFLHRNRNESFRESLSEHHENIAAETGQSFARATSTYSETADKTYRQYDNSITFQIVPSTYPLQWETPRDLLFSLAKNRYFFPKVNVMLGHVATEVNCLVNGQRTREFIGAESKDIMGFQKYLADGYGLSLLNRPGQHDELPLLTIEGRLDDEAQDLNLFNEAIEQNNFGALSVVVSPENCQDALAFVQQYKKKTRQGERAGNRYGFGADPAKFEGAGCAPLAATIMAKAHLSELIQSFERVLFVPKSLAGNPEKNSRVTLWDLLWSSPQMTIADADALKFNFPDPQRLYDYLMALSAGDFRLLKKITFPESTSILAIVDFNRK